jgi:FixJ family two-component response regulator
VRRQWLTNFRLEAPHGRAAGPKDVDFLLLDIHLGGMSGIELRQQLKALGCSLPVIFMSAFDDEKMRGRALQEGCVAYLRKPFPSRLLIEAIEKSAQ